MNSRRARHLRDARDGHFDIGRRNEHQVRQLINDDDDVGKFFRNDDVFLARHDNFLINLDGESARARFDFFFLRGERQFHFLFRQRLVLRAFVKGLDVADADSGKNFVTLFHLVDDPAQREQHLFRIGDNGNHQVRQGIVLLQLDNFRINHHEA